MKTTARLWCWLAAGAISIAAVLFGIGPFAGGKPDDTNIVTPWAEDFPLLLTWSFAQRARHGNADLAAIGPMVFLGTHRGEIDVHARSLNRLLDGASLHPDDRATILRKDYDLSLMTINLCAALPEQGLLTAQQHEDLLARCDEWRNFLIFGYFGQTIVEWELPISFETSSRAASDAMARLDEFIAAETAGYGPEFPELLDSWRLHADQDAALVAL